MKNSITQFFRLKKPCSNCPFRKSGAIKLSKGRLAGIVKGLEDDDSKSFKCHKTLRGDDSDHDDDGEANMEIQNHHAMCAGAAAFLKKNGKSTIGMRIAMMTKDLEPSHWDEAMPLIVDEVN